MISKFDERVECAINNIWIKSEVSLVEESLQMLRDAANMGDGDAYYFLGRCYVGERFVSPKLGLPIDVKFAHECFDMSVLFESSVGMFGTMHIDDFEPKLCRSKREIWNDVARMAYSGNIFCKYLLGNAYYYGYVADFKGGEVSQYDWNAGALVLYEECVEAGLGIALHNLLNLLYFRRNGERKHKKEAAKYIKIGANMGIEEYIKNYNKISTL